MATKENGIKKFFGEFKKFITRGNVLDMAVGVIVGGAFTAIINALSNNILKPLIDWLLAAIIGGDSLSEIYTVLKPVYDQTTGLLDLTQSIYIDWGAFINAIINFLLIAFVLFCIVKTINRLNDAKDKAKGELLAERAAVKKYRREGLTKAEAMAKYQADLKAAEEAKAEEARLAADKAAAEKAAAEAKAEANTKLLEEIRDLLKNR
jgi:large conductance mechanosensitive channel protein